MNGLQQLLFGPQHHPVSASLSRHVSSRVFGLQRHQQREMTSHGLEKSDCVVRSPLDN